MTATLSVMAVTVAALATVVGYRTLGPEDPAVVAQQSVSAAAAGLDEAALIAPAVQVAEPVTVEADAALGFVPPSDGLDAADIPEGALAAYQRASQVMSAADTTCNLPWTLLAGVAHAETDHGATVRREVTADGALSEPYVSPPLDGRGGRGQVADTDTGSLDGDRRWDRRLGVFRVLPTTWAAVGVDADDDGVRDPQDLDDAALAVAVLLCSGDEDLAKPQEARDALRHVHDSRRFVEAAAAAADAYEQTSESLAPSAGTMSVRMLPSGEASPSASPTASPSASPSATPSASASPTRTPTHQPSPTKDPTKSPAPPKPSKTPTTSPSPTRPPVVSPTPTPSATPSVSASPAATPSATP